jgi:hypothetical protein
MDIYKNAKTVLQYPFTQEDRRFNKTSSYNCMRLEGSIQQGNTLNSAAEQSALLLCIQKILDSNFSLEIEYHD